MQRFKKYLALKNKVKSIAACLAAAEVCPLGHKAISGYLTAYNNYKKLKPKSKKYVDNYVYNAVKAYDESGACEYDSAILYGN